MMDSFSHTPSNMPACEGLVPTPTEETALVPPMAAREQPSISRRRPASNWKFDSRLVLYCGVVCCFGIIFAALSIDSEHYKRYEELGFSPSLISAQSFADTSKFPTMPIGSSSLANEPPVGCESTVLLVRHCEKGNVRSDCNYVGFERSVYLATLFGDGNEKWPAPSYVFALHPGHRNNPKKKNFREVQTVQHVAAKFGLDINEDYSTSDKSKLAKKLELLMNSGELCGKVAIISWKHSDLSLLARKLGCGPLDGCPYDYSGKDFDSVWQIKFVYGKFPRRREKLKHNSWKVFGSVQREGFDPLAFSKSTGDYPIEGTSHGGRWKVN